MLPVDRRHQMPVPHLVPPAANTTHAAAIKIFSAIAVVGLAATIYTAFWFTATPAVVIAAFKAASLTTLISSIIAIGAYFLKPSERVNRDQPALEQDQPERPPAAVPFKRPLPSAPPLPAEPEEGSQEAGRRERQKQHQAQLRLRNERLAKTQEEYDARLQALEVTHEQNVLKLQPLQKLIERHHALTTQLQKAENNINRVFSTTAPDPVALSKARANVATLEHKRLDCKKELVEKQTEKQTYLKAQGLNKQEIATEIQSLKEKIQQLENTPVQRIWNASSANQEQSTLKTRLQRLEEQMGWLISAEKIEDPRSLDERIKALSRELVRLEVEEIKPKAELRVLEQQESDYNALREATLAKDQASAALKEFRNLHGYLSVLEANYRSQIRDINDRHLQAKANAKASFDARVAAEREPLAPLD